MNWKDIKNLIKEELTEGSQNHIVKYSKPNNTYQVWLGDKIVTDFATKEKANAKAKDLNDLQSVKDVDAAQKIAEATTVNAGNTKFNLRTGVNKNPTKLGLKIQFEPLSGELDKEVKSKLEVALQEKLNTSLAEYDMQISKDTDVPRPNVIGFFIPLAQLKNLIVKALTGQKVDAPAVEAPEPEGGEDSEIDEMIKNEMINEMKVRDLNEASSIVNKDDFYAFINAGNNIIRDMEEAGKSKAEAKKYLAYLTKHNIM